MYLQVIAVEDIASADGLKISNESYHGIPREPHLHQYEWPRRPPNIPPNLISHWQAALQKCVIQQYGGEQGRNIRPHLYPGDWKSDPTKYWPWMYNPSQDLLFHREGLLWIPYSPVEHGG